MIATRATDSPVYKDYCLPIERGFIMCLVQVQQNGSVNIMNWCNGMMDNHTMHLLDRFKEDVRFEGVTFFPIRQSWPSQMQPFPQVNLATYDESHLREALEDLRVKTLKRLEELRAREALEELRAVTPEQTPPVGQPVKAEAPLAPKAPPPVPLPPAPAAGSAQNPWQDMNAGKGAWKCDFGKGAGKCGGKGPRDRYLNLSVRDIPVTYAYNQEGCIIAQALCYSMGRK